MHSFKTFVMIFTYLFIYLGFYFQRCTGHIMTVVGRAEETSVYSWSRFLIVNGLPTASTYQLSHLRSGRELTPGLRRGRRESYHICHCGPPHDLYNLSTLMLFIHCNRIIYCEKYHTDRIFSQVWNMLVE